MLYICSSCVLESNIREEKKWCYLLADKTKQENYIIIDDNNMSNITIFRRTLNFLLQNKHLYKDLFVIVGWVDPKFFEMAYNDNIHLHLVDLFYNDFEYEDAEDLSYYAKNIKYNALHPIKHLIEFLTLFLTKNNIKHIFFYNEEDFRINSDNEHMDLVNLCKKNIIPMTYRHFINKFSFNEHEHWAAYLYNIYLNKMNETD